MLSFAKSLCRVRHVRALSSSAAAEQFDAIVIGGGPGGYVAAIKGAQLGLKVACIESRGRLGGTCLNVGCIPSKALLHSSHLFEESKKHLGPYGVKVGSVELDLNQMMANKDKVVEGLTGGVEFLFRKNKVSYVKGHATVTGAHTVSVKGSDGKDSVLETKNVVLVPGSMVKPIPGLPVDNSQGKIVDSTGALSLSSVPKRMAVIGGGVIGLELGSVWRRLGSTVEVLEFMDRVAPFTDKEVGMKLQQSLKKQGMKFHLKTKVLGSEVKGDCVLLNIEENGKASVLETDVALVCIGRIPNTKGVVSDALKVEMDQGGRYVVNSNYQTTVPSIYAIGDAIQGPMLAHKVRRQSTVARAQAEDEGIAVMEHLAGKAGHVNYDVIPSVIYTDPEFASVGKTEEQLVEQKIPFKKGIFPFSANSRARAMVYGDGLVKFLSHAETGIMVSDGPAPADRILGVHILGPNASEMIAEACLAMEYGASSEDIGRTCHAHPTLSEAFREAAMAVYEKSIHF